MSREAPPLGSPAILRQRWSEVTFLHWRVDPRVVERFMPAGCRPDVIDGSTWVGLIAFQMSRSSFFGGPSIPWLGDFPEVNVRLYSIDERGRRGVVFLSLEASHLIPVLTAQAAFGLPYRWASMTLGRRDGKVAYKTRRHGQPDAASHIIVQPIDDPAASVALAADPVAMFLTARWGFHETYRGRTIYCRNHHEPWPLQPAELLHLDDGLLAAAGFEGLASRPPDSVLYASRVTTVFAAPHQRKWAIGAWQPLGRVPATQR
ncbi:hypothetical protein A20C1_09014 [marine actinobacterium PHSC20C1]|nr:hypothetical protein A20C1_09014 [marine actinobacterium PHSC20C1]